MLILGALDLSVGFDPPGKELRTGFDWVLVGFEETLSRIG